MSIYQIDPLKDPRWVELLEAHPDASIFHTPGWLKSLKQSYGYEPLVLTTCPPRSQLTNGLAFCRIKSWATGDRMVSVPFADHCQPLFEKVEDFHAVLEWVSQGMGKDSRKPVEIRPLDAAALGLQEYTSFRMGKSFRIHLLDLSPSLDELMQSFDKNSVQRRIRRFKKEGLGYEEGRSPELLKQFYRLQIITRRKHQVPPQPMAWFRNLITFLGDGIKIRVVSKGQTPIASIINLEYKGTVIYKYGCSDALYNNLAGSSFLFWQIIQEAKQKGIRTFDLGRSDLDNPGLINFKSNWGTRDLPLTYWSWPEPSRRESVASTRSKVASYVVSRLPDGLLVLLGSKLYRHMG
jgi:hypothetical protein